MSKPLQKHDGTNVIVSLPGIGILFAHTAGVPSNSTAGYSKGCLNTDQTNGKLYINTGTLASSTWTVVGSQS